MTYIALAKRDSGELRCPATAVIVQGRILSSINDSKLTFHVRMHLPEVSRNIQEP